LTGEKTHALFAWICVMKQKIHWLFHVFFSIGKESIHLLLHVFVWTNKKFMHFCIGVVHWQENSIKNLSVCVLTVFDTKSKIK
jgi:hypothetical protein